MTSPHEYNIVVKLVHVDDETLFRGRVLELSNVETYGASYDEAYQLAIDAITNLSQLANEKNLTFPLPRVEEEEYSGRVTLRMPKWLHRQASELARSEDVSLNHYIVMALSHCVGRAETTYTQAMTLASGTLIAGQSPHVPWPVPAGRVGPELLSQITSHSILKFNSFEAKSAEGLGAFPQERRVRKVSYEGRASV